MRTWKRNKTDTNKTEYGFDIIYLDSGGPGSERAKSPPAPPAAAMSAIEKWNWYRQHNAVITYEEWTWARIERCALALWHLPEPVKTTNSNRLPEKKEIFERK